MKGQPWPRVEIPDAWREGMRIRDIITNIQMDMLKSLPSKKSEDETLP